MEHFLLFVFAAIGFTLLVVDSYILQDFRNFLKTKLNSKIYKVFECYQCMGFWTGIISGAIIISLNPFIIFLCGCAGSFLSMLGGSFLTYLEAITVVSLEDNND